MPLVSQTMAALEAARAARAAIPNPPNTPGVESLVASFISKVDACQSSVDRLTSMVEAELAARGLRLTLKFKFPIHCDSMTSRCVRCCQW